MTAQRRHPLEVTADRLRDAVEQYAMRMSGAARDDIGRVIFALETLVNETARDGNQRSR